MSGNSSITLRARWVFPVCAEPIADGYVTINDGRIVAVGRRPSAGGSVNLGDVAILPGLVNAHTHLEFSDLAAPVGDLGLPLPDWIRRVVAHRRASQSGGGDGVQQGLRESLSRGVTTLGEIATRDWRTALDVETLMPRVRMFWESIAPTRARVAPALTIAAEFCEAPQHLENIPPGLSPHAPYTVHADLLAGLIRLSQRHALPVAMHLAESREELELLATGRGRFRTMLEDFDAWEDDTSARYPRILNYLEALSTATRALVIHGNYLAADEIEFLATNAERLSLIYCPRTHHFFGHEPYPLAAHLAKGVSVALGTDGRSSNPDLDLFAEMKFIVDNFVDVPPATVLQLGTLAGAHALGMADALGSLEPGKRADLAIVSLDTNDRDPYAALFHPDSRVTQTWLAGRCVTAGNS